MSASFPTEWRAAARGEFSEKGPFASLFAMFATGPLYTQSPT